MKPSEYGGSDTDKTYGIQPAPHAMKAHEQLRMIYTLNPADPGQPVPTDGSIDEMLTA